jgi:hypothetical protein
VHTQINVSTSEEVLFFWYSSSSPKAGKMRAADGSAAAADTKRVKKMGSLLPMLHASTQQR